MSKPLAGEGQRGDSSVYGAMTPARSLRITRTRELLQECFGTLLLMCERKSNRHFGVIFPQH